MDNSEHDGIDYCDFKGKRVPIIQSNDILDASDWVCLMWFERFNHTNPYDWGCENYEQKLAITEEALIKAQSRALADESPENFVELTEAIYQFARAKFEISDSITDTEQAWALIGQQSFLEQYTKIKTGGRDKILWGWSLQHAQQDYTKLALDNSLFYTKYLQECIQAGDFPFVLSLKMEWSEHPIFLRFSNLAEAYRVRDIGLSSAKKVKVLEAIKNKPKSAAVIIQMLFDQVSRHSVFKAVVGTLNTSTRS